MHRLLLVLIVCSILLVAPSGAWAQPADQPTVTTTEATGVGLVAILYATVAALWAIDTKRNPVGWFIVGLLFTVLAAFAVLYQASQDQKKMAVTSGK